MGEKFTYSKFVNTIQKAKSEFNPMQITSLEQRMVLLSTFVDPSADHTKSRFQEGQLTVVDLSDPFVDSASACALFEIVTRMFVRAEVGTGKVLVVDEAHKVCGIVLSVQNVS